MAMCGAFQPGFECYGGAYVELAAADASAEACITACKAQGAGGCCWYHDQYVGGCQWVAGGTEVDVGGPTARSAARCAGPLPAPEQLHVALGESPDALLVQWAAANYSAVVDPAFSRPALRFRLLRDAGEEEALWSILDVDHVASGPGPYAQFRSTLTGLEPAREYEYNVGWLLGNGTSAVDPPGESWPLAAAVVAVPPNDPAYLPAFAFFGDLGWTDNQILPLLGEECAARTLDAVVLFGDMVYFDDGENENSFMRDLSALSVSASASVPVMVSPGNGDYDNGLYSRYKAQFAMPGWQDTHSLWHSFDMGPAHVVGINTEALEFERDATVKERMLAWFADDMAAANAPQARAARPWVIVHFHRPAYTTGSYDAKPYEMFEPLMVRYGVDAVFAGHIHNQERTLPVANSTLVPSPDPARPYTDARAPVYFVSGNPGNAEETNTWFKGFDPWTAWRSYHYGYTRLSFPNTSALTVEFVATNLGGATTDSVTMVKSHCNAMPLAPADGADAGDASRRRRADGGKAARRAALQQRWRERDSQDGPVPAAQVAALTDLFHATGGATTWVRSDNWLAPTDPCDATAPWYGVSCTRVTERTLPHLWNASAARGVTALQLAANGLLGTLPDSLGTALGPSLQYLELGSNQLRGELPQSLLSGMPRLHTLYVEPRTDEVVDKLTGTLPAGMGDADGLPNLRFLGLSRNALSGDIPPSFGKLPCYVTGASGGSTESADPSVAGHVACLIWLRNNSFTGTVPDEMCRLAWGEVYLKDNTQMSLCPVPCLYASYFDLAESCKTNCTKCQGWSEFGEKRMTAL